MYRLLTHVEVRSPWFYILSTELGCVYIFGKVLLRHAEVLVFELLDPSLKGTILVSQLN